jgi:c(7)-type cytochrome triheme protein
MITMKRRIAGLLLVACTGVLLVACSEPPARTVPTPVTPEGPGIWQTIMEDQLHDPAGPGATQLQNPAEALFYLPSAYTGNKVRWAEAIEEGYIEPRASILDNNYQMQVLDLDVIRTRTAEMPMVLFPHKKHTIWLECGNCHEWLFKSKRGATRFGMFDVLSGEYCGRCHGAVAFPLLECYYCHSVKREELKKPVTELQMHK